MLSLGCGRRSGVEELPEGPSSRSDPLKELVSTLFCLSSRRKRCLLRILAFSSSGRVSRSDTPKSTPLLGEPEVDGRFPLTIVNGGRTAKSFDGKLVPKGTSRPEKDALTGV